MNLLDNAVYLIKDIETFELSQQAQRKSKEMLEKSVVDYQNKLHTAVTVSINKFRSAELQVY